MKQILISIIIVSLLPIISVSIGLINLAGASPFGAWPDTCVTGQAVDIADGGYTYYGVHWSGIAPYHTGSSPFVDTDLASSLSGYWYRIRYIGSTDTVIYAADQGSPSAVSANVWHQFPQHNYHTLYNRTSSGYIAGPFYVDLCPYDPNISSQTPTITATSVIENQITYTFVSTADNWIASGATSANYGTETTMWVGDQSGSSNVSRGLLQFNIDLIPPDAQILNAVLQLTTSVYNSPGDNRTLDLYLLNKSWSETGSKWYYADFDSLSFWDDALGGGAPNSVRVLPATSSALVSSSPSTVSSIDVSDDVIKIVTGQNQNYGWVIVDHTEADGHTLNLYTREAASYDDRPKLIITFVENDTHVDASWLNDGNFEENSTDWIYSPSSRRLNEIEFSADNVGPAACGDYYAVVDDGYNDALFKPRALAQRFYWPGGIAYFHAYWKPNGNDTDYYEPKILIERADGADGVGGGWMIIPNRNHPAGDWFNIIPSSYYLSPGFYDLLIGSQENALNHIADWAIDDVAISLNSYMTYCNSSGQTRTPYPSKTPTATVTRTPSATAGSSPTATVTPSQSVTPTGTATAKPATGFSNCNFEGGSAGWYGTDWQLGLAGGPIGPQYAIVNGTIYQPFSWPGGQAYFTFWIGPGSYGSIVVRNINTNVPQTLYVAVAPDTWRLQTTIANLPAGSYQVEVIGSASHAMKVDGVLIASNTFAYCGSGNGNPVTPTSGPTAYVTPTFTWTPNASLSPTPSRTASRTASATITKTPYPSNTPMPSNTPQPTHTQPATPTMIPTSTLSDAEQTATAQGTDIPTYTPFPTYTSQPTYTPFPSTTPYATPPQQPPAGPGAECVPPTSGDVAGWLAYQQCQSLSFISWSPTNTAQIQAWPTAAAGKEPFGTINQFGSMLITFSSLLNSYDWSASASCSELAPDPLAVLRQARGLLLGEITFTDTEYYFEFNCNMAAADIVGPYITRGMCMAINILCLTGFLPWMQWIVNIVLIAAFCLYIKVNWIDKAMQ
jgi:hypothetical protein